MIFLGYCVGNIAASYTVKSQELHVKYRSTWITVIVAMAVTSIASIILRFVLISMNKKRDTVTAPDTPTTTADDDEKTIAPPARADGEHVLVIEKLDDYVDLTDKQLPAFRYTL